MDVLPRSWRRQRGDQAEQAASQWLQQQGLQLIERNWRCRLGEIDLIMRDDQILVFVEVRYRGQRSHGGAAASVDTHKQRRLIAAARYYLGRYPYQAQGPCRFDVLAMEPGRGRNDDDGEPDVQWIQNAFYGE
ncbi:MAG: YraN family protein [Gammaproteobacteria bacterium HGW-Gammaproteobacteria-14]|nr:MAG: YraN family protein [Gammaproteobacteria bacterium HGW-Gammaproteobacteria-14]